jgi:hypothetical protein
MGVQNIQNSIWGMWPCSTVFTKYFMKITAHSMENKNEVQILEVPTKLIDQALLCQRLAHGAKSGQRTPN